MIADGVPVEGATALTRFQQSSSLPVQILEVAPADSADASAMDAAAAALKARVVRITPDDEDVRGLIRDAARSPRTVAAADRGTRWAESGWWLVPVLCVLTLVSFRRTVSNVLQERDS